MAAATYQIEVTALSPEDGGGFLAWVPDLPGCVSDGETRDQAIANVESAIAEWIDEAVALGRAVPSPSRSAIRA